MANETRWRVAKLPDGLSTQKIHTWNDEAMKPARHLVLAEYCDGPMIYRYSDNWELAGDTWHENTANALIYIEAEFGVSNLEWRTVSEDEATALMTQRNGK
jgi:hypothetical protein